MIEVFAGATTPYVYIHTRVHSLPDLLEKSLTIHSRFAPVSGVLIAGFSICLAVALYRRDREAKRRCALTGALLLAAYVAVAMQLKFYAYHYTIMLAGAVPAFACQFIDARRFAIAKSRPEWLRFASLALVLVPFPFSGREAKMWAGHTRNAIAWAAGRMSRNELDHTFFMLHYADYGESRAVGTWLREHSSPSEIVSVRGFEPEIYAIAERRYSGRFFWTSALREAAMVRWRQEWLEEDRKNLQSATPRFVVTRTDERAEPDTPDDFLTRGYTKRAEIGHFTILEQPKLANASASPGAPAVNAPE
jgi:hypothetical protein